MNNDWAERYSRQILLKEIGGHGQHRLERASVAIVGTSSMASPLILYLAAAGVAHLMIVEENQTTEKNRNTAHTAWLGQAAQRINPGVQITVQESPWHPDTIHSHVASWDLMVLTNPHPDTQKGLNTAALQQHKPILMAWSDPMAHYITASKAGLDAHAPCLFCQTSSLALDRPAIPPPDPRLLTLAEGVVGSLLAMESLKVLLDIGQGLWYTLLVFHSGEGTYTPIPTRHNPSCPFCQGNKHG